MKKILVLILLFVSIMANAQQEVTKFLGIPVDGYKPAMIEKLKAKGYEYNQRLDCLTGEFNGYNVRLSIVTNNNKVWRIVVQDAITTDETNIKIRFNNLCRQFGKNKKYIPSAFVDQTLSDNEDISYEMTVNKKRYEAVFYQIPSTMDTLRIQQEIRNRLLEKYTEEQLENPTEEIVSDSKYETAVYMYELCSKRAVWFLIDEQYGRYSIIMYYDNEYNHSDGEDL